MKTVSILMYSLHEYSYIWKQFMLLLTFHLFDIILLIYPHLPQMQHSGLN